MRRNRVMVAALAVITSGCLGSLVGPDPSSSPSALFDTVWQDFDRNYASFDLKNVDWDAVYTQYKPRADAAATPSALIPVIRDMFAELRDAHVDLAASGRQVATSVDLSALHTYFNVSTIYNEYVPDRRLTPSRNMAYGMVAPNVGYVWIGTFVGTGWEGEINTIVEALNTATAFVIDIRNNGGGNSATGNAIASRFTSERRVYGFARYRNGPDHSDFGEYLELVVEPGEKYFPGKVAVLMNRLSASAAESFALAMRSRPDVVFVGDTTIGASGSPMIRELANGWIYRVPQSLQYGVDRETYEGVGLAPDVVVPMTATDSVAKRDVQLERAVALIRP